MYKKYYLYKFKSLSQIFLKITQRTSTTNLYVTKKKAKTRLRG